MLPYSTVLSTVFACGKKQQTRGRDQSVLSPFLKKNYIFKSEILKSDLDHDVDHDYTGTNSLLGKFHYNCRLSKFQICPPTWHNWYLNTYFVRSELTKLGRILLSLTTLCFNNVNLLVHNLDRNFIWVHCKKNYKVLGF